MREMPMSGQYGGGFSTLIESGDEGNVNDELLTRPKRQKGQLRGVPKIEDGLAAFGSSVREAELAKVDLEKQRLEFEERLHNDFMREREAVRKAQAQENERKDRADMERLKAMLDFAVSSIKNATQK